MTEEEIDDLISEYSPFDLDGLEVNVKANTFIKICKELKRFIEIRKVFDDLEINMLSVSAVRSGQGIMLLTKEKFDMLKKIFGE
jgi:hypothetical protein